MSSFLGQDSIDRANRMAAIRMRKRAPDPNVGSHLPPPPGTNPHQPQPPAAAAADTGSNKSNAGVHHGRRSRSITEEEGVSGGAEEQQQQSTPAQGAPPPRGGGNDDQSPNPGMPPHAQPQPQPPQQQQQQHTRSSRVHYVGGSSNPVYSSSMGALSRVEMQPLGLTQIFGSKHQPGGPHGGASQQHQPTSSSLIGDILQEGKGGGPTAKPSPDLLRCADYVQTQPDALDAFLRKYAISGGGGGVHHHIPGGPGEGAATTTGTGGGGGGGLGYPPLRLLPPPVPTASRGVEEGGSHHTPNPNHSEQGGYLPLLSPTPSPKKDGAPAASSSRTAASVGEPGGVAPAPYSNSSSRSKFRNTATTNPNPPNLKMATPPTIDPANMLLAESTFVRPSKRTTL